MDAVTQVPAISEPVHEYAPGSPERARLIAAELELSRTTRWTSAR